MTDYPVLRKRPLIKQYVAGKSFIDIGGLWGTNGETVTTALQGGASRATMADIQPLGNKWWTALQEHAAAKGVSGYEEIRVDICKPGAPEQIGVYDFVHCAGLMYHVADLFSFLANLLSITGEYLLISSVVMPDEIRTRSGSLQFTPDRAYLAPILTPENKQVMVDYLTEVRATAAGLTTDEPVMKGLRAKTGPWWWLFSADFMSSVLRLHGLEIVAEGKPGPRKDRAQDLLVHQILARKPSA